jgi:hypothetical protein
MLRIVGSSLAVHLALQPTLFLRVRRELLARSVTSAAAPSRGTMASVEGPISSPTISAPTFSCFGLTKGWPSSTSCA